jgi:hypothetical protein
MRRIERGDIAATQQYVQACDVSVPSGHNNENDKRSLLVQIPGEAQRILLSVHAIVSCPHRRNTYYGEDLSSIEKSRARPLLLHP